MYKRRAIINGNIAVNDSYDGETIEVKIEKVTTSKEPIDATAPIIYTEKKDGVLAGYNVRTDRFEIALQAMDKIHRSKVAKTENKVENKENSNEAYTQATDEIEDTPAA